MAKAFTPGLTVTARATYRARRVLPIEGEVTVKAGDRVDAGTVVAQTFMEGDVFPMKVAGALGAQPKDLPGLMLKKVGDAVRKDEPIARSKGIFGMMRTEARSTADGVIESVGDSTGMVMVRGPKVPIEVRAYVAGTVVEVLPGEGAVVEAAAALVQGIFGIGGEVHGPVAMACAAPDEELDADDVTPAMRGCVVVGGARMTAAAIARAREVGAAAVVSGGIDDQDLRDFLGHDIGVAVTGSERMGITLIVTEGFGSIAMAARTFALLASHAGRTASVNGATQIRAGVMRPEIVVPLDAAAAGTGPAVAAGGATAGVLEVGTPVRVIRDPHFGVLGTVAALPEQPAVLGSGSKARVLEVAVAGGGRITVPRANVELIEG
jgi:pyruvate/2-oxoglutarate dehydrogenase complex dihydrolipoamide acyltransferase (E2) component